MTQSLKTAETDALKILMIQRAITTATLAAKSGVSEATLRNQIANNFPSSRLRFVIEAVLNIPIWSSITEFESRIKLAAHCGFDPFIVSVPRIQKALADLKIRGRSNSRKKGALIKLLENHFAVNTKPHTT